jgi:hypothetical protein
MGFVPIQLGEYVRLHVCFTCITGESYPVEDYEIAEACGPDR